MGQNYGENRFLTAKEFSKEIVLWANLGPMHLLDDEVLKLDSKKYYLRKLKLEES